MSVHVAVLMGGWSAERSVSLASGEACAKALEEEGYRVSRVDVGPDVAAVLSSLKPDVALNALHGRFGEDGCIQGILEVLAIPYTHSGVLASALAMRKDTAKTVLAAAGIPVAEGVTVDRREAAKGDVLKPPYVVKPVCEGSSFGVLIVREENSNVLQQLVSSDWKFGDQVLVEHYVAGRELTCGVMGDKVLDIIEIVPAIGAFYDFDAKYAKGGSKHILPAPIGDEAYARVQNYSLAAHKAMGCRGVSRADFRLDDGPGGTGELVIMEVNTQPGMTETSLVPDMARHMGLPFSKLVRWMVEDASCNR
jgi:D-alanine-D-alanine ligase